MNELFKNIEENFPKELKNKGKLWIYRDKIIVYDVVINGNKIAFDITPNLTEKSVKLKFFSRNILDSLNELKKELIYKNEINLELEQGSETVRKIIEYIERISNAIANKNYSPIEQMSKYIEESIKKTKYLKKFWIYKNRTIVLDMQINGNNLVFSIVPNFETENLKIFFWSRKYFDGLKIYDKKLNKTETGSYVIFDGKLVDIEKAIFTVNLYMYDVILNFAYSIDKKRHEIVINRIREKIKKNRKIKIGFFVSEASKWNSQNIYEYFSLSSIYDSEIVVFSSSNELKFKDRFEENRKETLDFFSKCGKIKDAYSLEKNRHLTIEELGEYDIVFVQQPWGFRDLPLRLFGISLVCYMLYGYAISFDPVNQCKIETFFPYLYRHYAQDTYHQAYLEKYQPFLKNQTKIVGYSKFDSLKSMEEFVWKNNSEKKIIFAPHYSFLGQGIKIGTFDWSGRVLAELRESYNTIAWLYKPHPRLSTVIEKIMTKAEYKQYCEEWEKSENSIAKYDGEYLKAFQSSSVMITDCESFLGEYMFTGNPIIRLMSKYDKGRLNDTGEKINSVCYRVNNKKELLEAFENIIILGKDPLKKDRLILRNELFSDGFNATKNIINDIESIIDLR